MTEYVDLVENGISATELQQVIRDDIEEVTELFIMDRAALWEICMLLVMKQGIAGLKEYSREEFRERTGYLPKELPVMEISLRSKLQKGYKIRTPLTDMPDEIQMKIYEAVALAPEKAAHGLSDIRKEYGENSAIAVRQSERKRQKNVSEVSWLYEKETPYRRQTPKIGRNDPCPCGSGKKYKKCCGRKI